MEWRLISTVDLSPMWRKEGERRSTKSSDRQWEALNWQSWLETAKGRIGGSFRSGIELKAEVELWLRFWFVIGAILNLISG